MSDKIILTFLLFLGAGTFIYWILKFAIWFLEKLIEWDNKGKENKE